MKNPVDQLDFWKERIERAKKEYINYSVYLANPALWKSIGDSHKKILDKLVTGHVLDAGCGYGRLSEWIEDYTGTDFSPDFIELAREKYPTKTFVQADLKALPFKDKEFDWAVCVSIRHMIIGSLGEDVWQQMEKELKRVAKKILILEYTSPDTYEIIDAQNR
jgi:ubiquinone/menaquinone biosynthesis C-methylase UbiE